MKKRQKKKNFAKMKKKKDEKEEKITGGGCKKEEFPPLSLSKRPWREKFFEHFSDFFIRNLYNKRYLKNDF